MKKIIASFLAVIAIAARADSTVAKLTAASTPATNDLMYLDQGPGTDRKLSIGALDAYLAGYFPQLGVNYNNPSWVNQLAWSKITGTPTTLGGYGISVVPWSMVTGTPTSLSGYGVTSANWSLLVGTPTSLAGYGITDPVVVTGGSYANPSWIPSYGWSKLTGTPTTLSGYGITDAARYRVIDVMAPPYNAVGDGVTDDTTAIVNAFQAQQSGSGLVALYFPSGHIYKISSGLGAMSNPLIMFSDSTSPQYAGINQASSFYGATIFFTGYSDFMQLTQTANFISHMGFITPTASSYSAIYCNGSPLNTFEDLYFMGFGYAMKISGGNNSTFLGKFWDAGHYISGLFATNAGTGNYIQSMYIQNNNRIGGGYATVSLTSASISNGTNITFNFSGTMPSYVTNNSAGWFTGVTLNPSSAWTGYSGGINFAFLKSMSSSQFTISVPATVSSVSLSGALINFYDYVCTGPMVEIDGGSEFDIGYADIEHWYGPKGAIKASASNVRISSLHIESAWMTNASLNTLIDNTSTELHLGNVQFINSSVWPGSQLTVIANGSAVNAGNDSAFGAMATIDQLNMRDIDCASGTLQIASSSGSGFTPIIGALTTGGTVRAGGIPAIGGYGYYDNLPALITPSSMTVIGTGAQTLTISNLTTLSLKAINTVNLYTASSTASVGGSTLTVEGDTKLTFVTPQLGAGGLTNGDSVLTQVGGVADFTNAAALPSVANKLPLSGGTMSGAIAMGSSKITGLADPSNAQDAMTLNYFNTYPNPNDVITLHNIGSSIKAETCPPGLASQSTTLTSQQLVLVAVTLPQAATLTGVGCMIKTQGNYTTNNFNGFGLYTLSGTTLSRVAVTANNTSPFSTYAANTYVQTPFTTTYAASAGLYFVGILYSQSAVTTAPALFAEAMNNSSFNNLELSNGVGIVRSISSATAMPTMQSLSSSSAPTLPTWVTLY